MSKPTIAPEHQEIEVRFLEIDTEAIKRRLTELGAEDLGEHLLDEVIFYDADRNWVHTGKFIRLRTRNEETKLTYKNHHSEALDEVEEIEFVVGDQDRATAFLERLGYPAMRHQKKKRHTFQLGDVTFDIDTWPRIPAYLEIEGPSEEALKGTADMLGLSWYDAVFESAGHVIANRYGIPVWDMSWFTFDRFE